MQSCPSCAAETIPDANFCGRCGARLKRVALAVALASIAACRCGAGPESIDAAGFCNECGMRQTDDGRDHEEQVIDRDFAAVTDRGLAHLRGLKGLEQLLLRGSKITAKGCQELNRALPKLRIAGVL